MIELLFYVCMIDQPNRCKEVKLTFEAEYVSTRECAKNGQFAMAPWFGENPNWVLQTNGSERGWHCQVAGQNAKL